MGKTTVASGLSQQFAFPPPPLTADLRGKSVLITGANSGIGFETALHFARIPKPPTRIVMACRSEEKGRDAAALIQKETGFLPEVRVVDLSDFQTVIAFAKGLEDVPLDIVVANAGVRLVEYQVSKDGWEQSLQINHLSTALLSFLLLPNLARAAEQHESYSRLVVVTSSMYSRAQIDEKLLSAPEGILATLSDAECSSGNGTMTNRYSQTKRQVFNIFFTRAFAQHLGSHSPIIATAVNPGFCVSNIRRNLPLTMRIGDKIAEMLMARTAEQGARQIIWAALGPDGKDGPHVGQTMRGAYVSTGQTWEPSDFVISREGLEVQENVWHETIRILSKINPLVQANVEKYLAHP
ncbi:NAD(P)-binding protein [Trametopsis cervina]|nr:NAD(P)-binding protein [Trametopsis cervina]